jgi:hypothetical protein
MYYTEGLDKIAVLLNPLFFDKRNINKHKESYNKLTLHPAGQFTVLSIHQEWFNPFFDYQVQIALALYALIKETVITFPDTLFTPVFVYKNPSLFILNIVACEFFFDFKQENIEIDPGMVSKSIDEASDQGTLYQYYDKKNNEPTDTYYSPDFTSHKKSQFICYNKLKKSIRDNNKAPVKELKTNQNEIRCEYKIYSCNSDWLHWDNFKGDYKAIFNRYKEYLAVIYNKYVAGCFTVHGKENSNFKKIIRLGEENNKIRFRNAGKKLRSKEPFSQEILHPHKALSREKLAERQKEIHEDFNRFPVKNVKTIKSRKNNELSSLISKNPFFKEKIVK